MIPETPAALERTRALVTATVRCCQAFATSRTAGSSAVRYVEGVFASLPGDALEGLPGAAEIASRFLHAFRLFEGYSENNRTNRIQALLLALQPHLAARFGLRHGLLLRLAIKPEAAVQPIAAFTAPSSLWAVTMPAGSPPPAAGGPGPDPDLLTRLRALLATDPAAGEAAWRSDGATDFAPFGETYDAFLTSIAAAGEVRLPPPVQSDPKRPREEWERGEAFLSSWPGGDRARWREVAAGWLGSLAVDRLIAAALPGADARACSEIDKFYRGRRGLCRHEMGLNICVVAPEEIAWSLSGEGEHPDERPEGRGEREAVAAVLGAAGLDPGALGHEARLDLRRRLGLHECAVLARKRGGRLRRFSLSHLARLCRLFDEPLAIVSFPLAIEDPVEKRRTLPLLTEVGGLFVGALAFRPGEAEVLADEGSPRHRMAVESLDLFRTLVCAAFLPCVAYMMRDRVEASLLDKLPVDERRILRLKLKGAPALEDLDRQRWDELRLGRPAELPERWREPHHWPGGWASRMREADRAPLDAVPACVKAWLARRIGESTLREILEASRLPLHVVDQCLQSHDVTDWAGWQECLSSMRPDRPGIVELAQSDPAKGDILLPVLRAIPDALAEILATSHPDLRVIVLISARGFAEGESAPRGPLTFNTVCLVRLLAELANAYAEFRKEPREGRFVFDEPDRTHALEICFSRNRDGGLVVRVFELGIGCAAWFFDEFPPKPARNALGTILDRLRLLGVEELVYRMPVGENVEQVDPYGEDGAIWREKRIAVSTATTTAGSERELGANARFGRHGRPANFEFVIPPPREEEEE